MIRGEQVPLWRWWPVARGQSVVPRKVAASERPDPLPAHVGLWLDRMLAQPYERNRQRWDGRHDLYRTAVDALALHPGADPPALCSYRPTFERWRARLEKVPTGFRRRHLTVQAKSRLLLHAASGSTVTEGSVLLHHTYGVPYLPGSALKGAVRARLRRFEASDELRQRLLGDLRASLPEAETQATRLDSSVARPLASLFDFPDALWIPEPPPNVLPGWSPLAIDVVTRHYESYYAPGNKKRTLDEGDEPVPVERLSVAPGTHFLIVVETIESPETAVWLDWLVDEVLVPALEEDGVGGWTTAGYGRLQQIAAAAGVEKRVREPAEPRRWLTARIFRRPDTGELTALLADGRRAFASAKAADALLAELPPDLLAALSRRPREARADVQLEKQGSGWLIVALRPPGDR